MNDDDLLAVAIPLVKADEGCRLDAYRDTLGVWTIGYGHAHVEPGTRWTQAQADAQLTADLKWRIDHLDQVLPWWRTLCLARRCVLLNMAFQLGMRGLLGFGHALEAIRQRRFSAAASLLLQSKWASQTPARAQRMASILSSGALPIPTNNTRNKT